MSRSLTHGDGGFPSCLAERWRAQSGSRATSLWKRRFFMPSRTERPAAIRPLIYVLRNEARGIALGFAISALGSITYYVGITYVPSFLATAGRSNEAQALEFSTIAALVVIAVTPCFGWLSDLAGRKPVLLGLCLACVILPVAMFQLIASGSTEAAIAGVAILAAPRRRRQRGWRDGDRRTIFRRGASERPGLGRHHGDGAVWRSGALCRPRFAKADGQSPKFPA